MILALPAEVVRKLKIREGDYFSITEAGNGIRLEACDRAFVPVLRAAKRFMKRYEGALRRLAT